MAQADAGYETKLRDNRAVVEGHGNNEPNSLLQYMQTIAPRR
jgi:hypothetical protein